MLGLAERDNEDADSHSVQEELVEESDDESDENDGSNVNEDGTDATQSTTQQSPEDTGKAKAAFREEAPSPDENEDDASSTSSLVDRANELRLGSDSLPQLLGDRRKVREVVAVQVSKARARNQSKYHSRRNPAQAGRLKGSKAKQDIRHKMDTGGVWG